MRLEATPHQSWCNHHIPCQQSTQRGRKVSSRSVACTIRWRQVICIHDWFAPYFRTNSLHRAKLWTKEKFYGTNNARAIFGLSRRTSSLHSVAGATIVWLVLFAQCAFSIPGIDFRNKRLEGQDTKAKWGHEPCSTDHSSFLRLNCVMHAWIS